MGVQIFTSSNEINTRWNELRHSKCNIKEVSVAYWFLENLDFFRFFLLR